MQEVAGKIKPSWGRTGWLPGALISTALVVFGWAWFLNADSFSTIWKMFGIANQTLAVIALAVVSAYLANEGRVRWVWVTLVPMGVVSVTTGSAAAFMLATQFNTIGTAFAANKRGGAESLKAMLLAGLIAAMVICAAFVVVGSLRRIKRSMAGETLAANEPGFAG